MHFYSIRCLMALLLSPLAFSQTISGRTDWDRPGRHEIGSPLQGQLEVPGTRDYSRLRVQLLDSGGRNVIVEGHVGPFGAFEIQTTLNGTCLLRIVNWQGDVVHSQTVGLPYHGVLPVKLGVGENAQARMPVSLTRMQHKVPKKALKAFKEAHAEIAAGHRDQAREFLELAIREDPQFFEAANDLGVMYLGDGRLSEAFEMFHRATILDEGGAKAEANLAYVLLALGRFPEAEEAARTSVRADGLSSRARYLLAVSLLEQRKSSKEVMFHLTRAQEGFEPARKLLQRLAAQGPKLFQ